jgi:hypothetical protein
MQTHRIVKKRRYPERYEALKKCGYESYPEYLRSELWKYIRQKVLDRDNHKCRICGEQASEIHHVRYTYEVLMGKRLKLMYSICRDCHKSIEFDETGKKRNVVEANMKAYDLANGSLQDAEMLSTIRSIYSPQKRQRRRRPRSLRLDNATKAVIRLLERNGYNGEIERDGDTYHAIAYHSIVTHPSEPEHKASGHDPYKVVCELAEACGIELEDG